MDFLPIMNLESRKVFPKNQKLGYFSCSRNISLKNDNWNSASRQIWEACIKQGLCSNIPPKIQNQSFLLTAQRWMNNLWHRFYNEIRKQFIGWHGQLVFAHNLGESSTDHVPVVEVETPAVSEKSRRQNAVCQQLVTLMFLNLCRPFRLQVRQAET